MRDRMNVYFPPAMLQQITELADRKKLSRSAIVEAAVASFLSPGRRGSTRSCIHAPPRPPVTPDPAT